MFAALTEIDHGVFATGRIYMTVVFHIGPKNACRPINLRCRVWFEYGNFIIKTVVGALNFCWSKQRALNPLRLAIFEYFFIFLGFDSICLIGIRRSPQTEPDYDFFKDS